MIGFTNMTWEPPETTEAQPGTYVSEAGVVEVAADGSITVLRDATEQDFETYPILIIGDVPPKNGKKGFPWWIILVIAGVTYAQTR